MRWLPPALLVLGNAIAWPLFVSGGMGAVYGWLALLTILPMIAVLAALTTIVHAVRARRVSYPMWLSLLLGLPTLVPGLWAFGIALITFPTTLDSAAPPATVRLPADVPLRVLWGGDTVEHNRHAATPDQRWAYDFVVEPALVGSTELTDYGCWGAAVLAPTSGTVSVATDGLPDEVPSRPSNNTEHPLGNSVAIEIDGGTYIVVAHLQQGSVLVSKGDRVDEGQPLGRCGNSGNTSEPHIHVHHQRQNPARYPVNFAEGLPLFFRDHPGAPMPKGGVEHRDGAFLLTGEVVQHEGARPATSERGRPTQGG